MNDQADQSKSCKASKKYGVTLWWKKNSAFIKSDIFTWNQVSYTDYQLTCTHMLVLEWQGIASKHWLLAQSLPKNKRQAIIP